MKWTSYVTEKDDNVKKFYEKTIKEEEIFHGKVINVHLQTVELPNGQLTKRELVRHPGAVAILPLTTDGKLIVVEQYRKALERSIIEIPAGKLEDNEDPYACAIRELKEETGYTSNNVSHLVSFYTSPGFADELIHLYIAHDCVPGEIQLDEDEFVESRIITLAEAHQMILEQQIIDAKTILSIYYWELLSKGLRSNNE